MKYFDNGIKPRTLKDYKDIISEIYSNTCLIKKKKLHKKYQKTQ